MITANVMTDPVTVSPDMTLAEAARVMLSEAVGCVQVVDDAGALLGVLTESDLLRHPCLDSDGRHVNWVQGFLGTQPLCVDYSPRHNVPVREVMIQTPVAVAPEDQLADVAALLVRLNVKRLPVVEDGTLVGVVSIADLVGALTQQLGAAVAR
ncbi:CBS domain-containing protein [Acidocella sp.]|uniref:CBS domain-containing protein n=1 Tax=Acidocella sp. TaxID=50710 RepID=UPI00261F8EC6|nr:CBS domain-containing protein [Acidocella sp.]